MSLLGNHEINQQKHFYFTGIFNRVKPELDVATSGIAAKASESMSGAKQISVGTPRPLYLFRLVLDFDVSIEARDF